jgi:hypothetical protein
MIAAEGAGSFMRQSNPVIDSGIDSTATPDPPTPMIRP